MIIKKLIIKSIKLFLLGKKLKKFIILTFVLIQIFNIFSEDKVIIGISPPYLRTENSATIFYNKQFSFELLFNSDSDKFNFEILNISELEKNKESLYLKECKKNTINNGYDYLLYSSVYSNAFFLYFKVQLLSPYNDDVIFLKIFIKKIDYKISETISECSDEIIKNLSNNKLEKIQRKELYMEKAKEEEDPEEQLDQYAIKFKHEFFFLNSFFKNHSNMLSLFEIYSGYNFSPFDFFSIEAAFFLGFGFKDADLSFSQFNEGNNFFIGQSAGFNFYLPFKVEPSLGLRFEINYIILDHVYFTFPIDLGIKVYITQKDAIKFNTSFQFITFDIIDLSWEKNFMIGFMIGYARKI